MKLKTLIAALSLLLCCVQGIAQEISVASFRQDEYDLSANLKETTVYDQNGEKCALIKIITTQKDFTFDVGSLGITKTEYKPSQVWVYVPHGVRKISIYHQRLGSLINWSFPEPIEAAKTYLMKITTDEVITVVQKKSTMDYLVVRVVPANAIIYLNDELLETQDGIATKLLAYGTYNYRVEADQYHAETGKVALDSGKKEITISLKPAFGYLALSGSDALDGADLRIDNKQVKFNPDEPLKLASGSHTVTIQKDFFRTYTQKVVIRDDERTPLQVSLVPDYTFLTVQSNPETELVLNGKVIGKGKWTGKLSAGAYRIEGKRIHHKDVVEEIIVGGMQDSRIITLEDNEPIYGSANITSTPMGCIVEIDGKEVGKTPCIINDLLEGKHSVRFSKRNFASETKDMVITEHNTTDCSAILKNSAIIFINVVPAHSSSRLYIDGKAYSSMYSTMNLSIGDHLFEVYGDSHYDAYSQTIYVARDTTIRIQLTESQEYKKAQAAVAREAERYRQQQAAAAAVAAKEAERIRRRNARPPFPVRVGWNVGNIGFSLGNEYSEGGTKYDVLQYELDLFASFGHSRNAFSFDVGAGYAMQFALAESTYSYSSEKYKFSLLLNQLPMYFRLNYTFMHRQSNAIYPYLAVEYRNYFTFTSDNGSYSSFGIPLRVGMNVGDIMHLDLYYEMCFSPYAYFNSSIVPDPVKYIYGNLGIGLSFIFGSVD